MHSPSIATAPSAQDARVRAEHVTDAGRTVLMLSNRDPEAEAIGDLYRRARSTMVDSVQCLIEAGHRLKAKKDSLAHGEWLPWLADNADALGFETRRTAARLMQLAEKWDAGVPLDEVEALHISREMWGHLGPVRGTAGTGEFERYTPAEYIDATRAVLGGIDLDPASCEVAQRTVKATKYYTYQDDGLAHEWLGRVWLNPPYHRELGPKFVEKLIAERAAGRITAAIMLTNNCTDTVWFKNAASVCAAICFTCGRVNFLQEDGETPLNPTQGQAFFYFGDDIAAFKHGFADIGFILLPDAARAEADNNLDIPECLRRAAAAMEVVS